MADVVDRIDVAFRGDGSGVAGLTWGQQAMLQAMERERSWLPMGGRRPVPPGTTVADVAEDLRYPLSRYQSFRTRLQLDPDEPRQAVEASGTAPLEVVDAGDEDPELVAADVERRYRTERPDLAADWPVRTAVICRDGTPVRLVAIMPHLVTDAIGAGIMVAEVAGRVATPVTGLQPLDLAQWQRSASGQRQSAAALRHWERHLRAADPATFGLRPVPPSPQRYRRGLFTSPALARTLPAAAARTGVDPATVLLTAFMTALSGHTGAGSVAVRQVVSNRFRSGLSDVVSPITQLGLCVADVSGPFDEALGRVSRAALAAHKYAYYNPLDLAALLSSVDVDVAHTACFNDRRSQRVSAQASPGGPATFVWADPPEGPTEPLFVHVDDVPGALTLTVDVDTAFLSPEAAEACARTVEEIITRAV